MGDFDSFQVMYGKKKVEKKTGRKNSEKKAQYKGCKEAKVYTYFKVKVDFSEQGLFLGTTSQSPVD